MDESAAGRLTVGATALVARAAVVRAAAVRCHEHQLHEGRERAKCARERGAVAQQRVGAAPSDLGSCGTQRRHLDSCSCSCERACVTKRELRDKRVKLPKNGGTADVIHANASEHAM